MYCDATGNPDPNGDFEILDGKVCIRDGRRLSFDLMFRDAASTGPRSFSDAKATEPTSIDAAVALAFKQAASRGGGSGDVASWLAHQQPKEIDALVTAAAVAFVRGHAGSGIAKHFSTDSALDAELTYRLTAARAKHDLAQASKPPGQRMPFTADAVAATVARVTAGRVASAVQQNDAASEVQRLRDEAAGARAARKHLAANAWRRS